MWLEIPFCIILISFYALLTRGSVLIAAKYSSEGEVRRLTDAIEEKQQALLEIFKEVKLGSDKSHDEFKLLQQVLQAFKFTWLLLDVIKFVLKS